MDSQQQTTIELAATIIRCGCNQPDTHPNGVCPRPAAVEPLGVIAAWNPEQE